MLGSFESGQVLLMDKPLHWTSADVVKKVRNIIKVKVGHAGTLDPLATGLLILCTGKFTKKINEYMSQEKEYAGMFTLGATTVSYDLENEPEQHRPFDHITEAQVREAALKFTGDILQMPPAYSAIKKNGRRSYDLAREGKPVLLEARKVSIKTFETDASTLPIVSFRVECSTGTYIRSLAHDIGAVLGCGAYLSKLVRTRIGSFRLEDAMTMEEAEKQLNALIRKDN